jgi:hypothetical protein
MAIITSSLFYAMAIGSLLDPSVVARLVKAFGPKPLGLTPTAFACGLMTILLLPMPWLWFHMGLILLQARRDGMPLFGLNALLSLFDVAPLHPHLTHSRRICLGGLVYYVVVVGAWIIYTAVLGI